jgi:hypothetical protein
VPDAARRGRRRELGSYLCAAWPRRCRTGPDQVVHTIVAIADSQRQVADSPDGSASSLACSATTAPQESTAF